MISGTAQQLVSLGTPLAALSAANTAAATSAWIDVRQVEGDVLVVSNIGIVSAGSITPTIEDATDGSGTGAAGFTDLKGGAFTAITTANDPALETRAVNAKATRGFIRYVGTIATGPALVGVSFHGRPKNG